MFLKIFSFEAKLLLLASFDKGAFTNYVDKILTLFDHVSIPGGQALTFLLPCMYCPRGQLRIHNPLSL